jgi:hypothetical protein
MLIVLPLTLSLTPSIRPSTRFLSPIVSPKLSIERIAEITLRVLRLPLMSTV